MQGSKLHAGAMPPGIRTPLFGLAALFTIFVMHNSIAAWEGSYPSLAADLIWGIAYYILVAMWMRADAHERQFALPFDFGLLLYMFGPLFLPWYTWSTQRWRGVIIALILLFAGYAPYLIGDLVWAYRVP